VDSRYGGGAVLFNTVAYAQFFAVVFVVVWLLVRRTGVLWVPWVALLGTTVFNVEGLVPRDVCATDGVVCLDGVAAVVCGLMGGWTYWLTRWQPEAEPPRIGLVLGTSVVHAFVFLWLTHTYWDESLVALIFRVTGFPWQPWDWLSEWVAQVCFTIALAATATLALCAKRIRLLFILGASYFFYAMWDWKFLPLIFASSSVDYWLGLRIGRAESQTTRRRWLWLTVVLNLGVLAWFKYLDFGIESARALLHQLGVQVPPWTLEVGLPVGVSFFTFESMSYVIDVYRRELEPHESYLEYLSFVAFFPHLVAGPIIRPRDLLPQLASAPRFSSEQSSRALYLIGWGLIKKVAIGDYLALNLIDRVFDAPTMYSSLEVYVAMVSYAVQIYCDFSGYTDIAIGSALLLGVRFPLNFNAPYKAHNIQDFWRRWHISLSTWLRDYLYVPLGGNRKGAVRTYVNLFVTMVLGGLWHGANWTFVVWGALHGAALAIHRLLTRGVNGKPKTLEHPRWKRGLYVFLTFQFVVGTWVFFRSSSFSQAQLLFSRLVEGSTYTPNLPWQIWAVLAAGLLSHWAPERWYRAAVSTFADLPAPLQALALGYMALIVQGMASADAVPFVYFQF
jgi:alginate O-acetyltransferase complex protein AlgI